LDVQKTIVIAPVLIVVLYAKTGVKKINVFQACDAAKNAPV
jgi:hypothetical protein